MGRDEHRHHDEQMLNNNPTTTIPGLGDEHGFTLIELLVSMLVAFVVTGALFAILEVSLHQTALITDKVQANQMGRTAMTRIIDELHSSCLAEGFSPLQEGSSETRLIFINAYSSEAVILNAKESEAKPKGAGTGVFEHQIVWNASAGTLTDFVYKSESGEGENAKFPALDYSPTTHEAEHASPKKGIRLASNVTESEENGKPVPIFAYEKYATVTTGSGSSTTPVSTLTKLEYTTELKKAEAEEAASVVVHFRQAPFDGTTAHGRAVDLSNQVTLGLSAPSAETPIKDSPCE
jgi:prepilin-type N-terminal cleavage/methylation domain-containing protein